MQWINSIGKYYFNSRLAAVEQWQQQPIRSQERVLLQLLTSARATSYGMAHGFDHIDAYAAYRERVPLADYDSLLPHFSEMMCGKPDVLWPGSIDWYAKSSGTTNQRSKYIPVSHEGLHHSHIKTGKDFLSKYLHNTPESQFFTGKGIVVGGSYQASSEYPNIFMGDVSAILMKNLDTWIQYFREPGLEIALMRDWEQKLERLAIVTAYQTITNLSGVPSWTLLLLRKVLEITGKRQIIDLWPQLELYCHGGVGFAPYRAQFEEVIGAQICYQNVYNASEGFFAYQDTLDNDDMLLHLDNGVFYEFIPFNGVLDRAHALSIADVQLGHTYALVITTNSGLWRYVIGDTLRFTSLAPYRICLTGRTKHYLNIWGEELSIDNTDKAIAIASQLLGATVVEYTVAPRFTTATDKGRHDWAIEFGWPPADLSAFATLLDNTLQALNSDYAAKRSGSMVLDRLHIEPMPQGVFYRWLQQQGRLGSQYKIPRLQCDRMLYEALMY